MKKLLIIIIVFISSFSTALAQDQLGLTSAGVTASYGAEIPSLGVGIRGQYGFSRHISGIAEYKYYLSRHNWSEWEVSADLHYVFEASDLISLYPLAGVKVSRWTYNPGTSPSITIPKESFNRIGLNVGVGGQVATGGKTFVQPEIKYEITKTYSQLVISVGLMYMF